MPVRQQIFALMVSVGVFIITILMVRRRTVKEEYALLWLGTSIVMFVLVLKYDWLVWLTGFIGAGLPTTTLFIGSIVFLLLIAVQFSIRISRLTDQVKDLAQENALLRYEIEAVKRQKVQETPTP